MIARSLTAGALAVVAMVWLSGCASPAMPFDVSKATEGQIKAMASDKSADAACSKIVGPWGTGVVVWLKMDKGSMPAGSSAKIGADCVTEITGK